MSLFGTGRREGVLAVLLLIALAMLQHAPGLLFGKTRVTSSPVETTQPAIEANGQMLLPAMRDAGDALRDGHSPAWNRQSRFGEPAVVSGAAMTWPPFWLLAAWPQPWVLDLLLWLHAALACATCYRFLRSLSISRYAAFLGGGFYGLGWFMTVALDRLPEAAAAAILPLVLELTWRSMFATHRLRYGAAIGLALAAMFATGGTATATLGTALVVVTFGFGLSSIDREDRIDVLRALGLAATVALLLLAPIWLDQLQLHEALRQPYEPTPRRLQPAGLIGALAPGLFGEIGVGTSDALGHVNPGASRFELALYPGALVLFLGLLGLMRPKRTAQALYWLIIAGLALMLAIDGLLSDLLASSLGWAPTMAGASLAILHLAVVVLAALGIENFFDAPRARRFAVPAAAAICLLLASITFAAWLPGTELLSLPVAWLTGSTDGAELHLSARHLAWHLLPAAISVTLIAGLFLCWHRLGILRFKAALATVALGELCVLAAFAVPREQRADSPVQLAELAPEGSGRTIRFQRHRWMPDEADLAVDRRGLTSVDRPGRSVLDRSARLVELIEPGSVYVHAGAHVDPLREGDSVDDPLLYRAGIDLLLANGSLLSGRFTPILAAPGGVAPNRAQMYTALESTPRARLAFRAETASDPVDAGRRLARIAEQPLDSIVIERPNPAFEARRPASEPSLVCELEDPDLLRYGVDMHDGRGYLVINEAWAPGWKATVDGEPQPILPADLAFRAIPISEGRHLVELRYEPLGRELGVPLAAAGLILALMALCWPRRRRA